MATRIVTPFQRINNLESEVLQRLQANIANTFDPIVALLANKENAALLTGGSNETGASILAKLLTVDGAGSGLDADLLDGQHAAAFALLAHIHSAADITSGILAVAQGGTGSSTFDVDNVTAGILAVARGGTGASTLGTNKAIQSDGTGVLEASAVTTTELGYVSGVTSAIQAQFTGKASTTHAANHKDSGSDDLLSAPGAIGDTTPSTGKFSSVEITTPASHEPIGVLDSQFTQVGNEGSGEDQLMIYTLPANTLDADGKAIRIKAFGSTETTGKLVTLKFHFGATAISIFAAKGDDSWIAEATVVRDASGSQAVRIIARLNGSPAISEVLAAGSPSETDTGTIIMKFTGENTTDAVSDAITQKAMITEILN